ncbi:hypothetical protein EDB83DRAFT_2423230, partial [Lactarius deliciosus]
MHKMPTFSRLAAARLWRCFRSRSDVTWLGCHIGHIVSPQLAPRYRSRQLPFSLSLLVSFAFAHPCLSSPRTAVEPTPSQDAQQLPIDRPRVPAPRVIFVPQHPVALLISHFPFKHVKFALGCLWPPARRRRSPCAAVGFGRGVVLSCVIVSWPPFDCYSHSLATFHS